jgi:serine/threonine protein kinase
VQKIRCVLCLKYRFIVCPSANASVQFLYFELEYAPTPLRSFKNLGLREHKCILFQALYALYIAQKEYKFVHNDLHAKNVLLQEPNPDRPFMAYQDFDRVWYVDGHVVKITDFGLSRLQLETREVVHNPKVCIPLT